MLKTGLKNSVDIIVTDDLSAKNMGSGSLCVLATPALIAGMENVCMNCVRPFLEEGFTTVGTKVNIAHLAATPLGDTVTYSCELIEIDRRRLVFAVQAFDSKGKTGEGTHERFIVDAERFMSKLQ
ncbi:MAG: thioesterase family protein [Clostridia bacterium]|nr:thioesterase family protein [Clostridia bacterium]MBO7738076.1 thioesterase family protein [Clostridia bacterium]